VSLTKATERAEHSRAARSLRGQTEARRDLFDRRRIDRLDLAERSDSPKMT
jgi:hypothetical protein